MLQQTKKLQQTIKLQQTKKLQQTTSPGRLASLVCLVGLTVGAGPWLNQAVAQQASETKTAPAPAVAPDVLRSLNQQLDSLRSAIQTLGSHPDVQSRSGRAAFADVAVCEKAVDWMLRHNEFFKPDYADQATRVLDLGLQRAQKLTDSKSPDWLFQDGSTVRGYESRVDGSIQPYAVTLPSGVNPRDAKRWPLHVVLHGRAGEMNEVNFIHRFEGKKAKQPIDWIQLDVFGRGNNAYRWAGETDVFEAMADVRQRFRIDEDRVTLHGFSMGGAGSWHLGLHYPDLWSSVGPGAGFTDFYKYQKRTDPLPVWQHQTLGIYDAVDYARNAANVPVCTYGGELDPQLAASTSMADAAAALNIPMKVIIGPGMGHKFDPESQKQFMAFHLEKSATGRQVQNARQKIRFTTRTLRYNRCDWLKIEQVARVYEPSIVEAEIVDGGIVNVETDNVTALTISRDIADRVLIDGDLLACRSAADGFLPDVYYQLTGDGWQVLDYETSRAFADNPDRNKRHGLQGPIDDAFMNSFVCVRGTGTPLNATSDQWAMAQLEQFAAEFDQWMRGKVRVLDDTAVDNRAIADNNLVLFGDPGSNAMIAKVLPDLPIQWTADRITVGDQSWDTKNHSISLIYPNPLNPSRYVVINSGHTFHDKDFRASNAWLFPRLGDLAVRSISTVARSDLAETSPDVVWAANFNSSWLLDD